MTDKEVKYEAFLEGLKFAIEYRLKNGENYINERSMEEIVKQIERLTNDR